MARVSSFERSCEESVEILAESIRCVFFLPLIIVIIHKTIT